MSNDITIRLNFDAHPERVIEAQTDELIRIGTTLFNQIHFLTLMYEEGHVKREFFLDGVYTASQLGAGVVEAIQTVRYNKEKTDETN